MRFGMVEVSGGFLLLTAWLNYLDREGILPMALLACLCHELGHYWTILALGGQVGAVRLTAVGAEMELEGPLDYRSEGLSALAGPGVNLALALFFCRWQWGRTFAGLNLLLACFNLVPVAGLDGGRALDCTLALTVGEGGARQIRRGLDLMFRVLLLLGGGVIFGKGGGITLLLTALWLCFLPFFGEKRGIGGCQTGGKRVQ